MGRWIDRIAGGTVGTYRKIRFLRRELGFWRFWGRIVGTAGLLGVLYLAFLWMTLPNLEDPASLFASQSTVITDRNGTELYRLFGEEDRTYVPDTAISPYMKKAIISIEDQRFYDRGCLDLRAMARAIFGFGQSGGASTLTRQLARNALNLKRENLFNRKFKEVILGCELEWSFDKDKILELYLNWIPYGNNAYGIEQASQRFFGVAAKDLTLGKAAAIASLPQRPSYFSPYGRHLHTAVTDAAWKKISDGEITSISDIPDQDITIGLLGGFVGSGTTLYIGGRSDQVVQNMKDQGFITEEERLAAIQEFKEMTFKPSRENIRAPYFVLWVKDQVEQMFEGTADKGLLEQGGLTIETSLDWRLQQAAEKAVSGHAPDSLKRFMAHNAGLVAMDPASREVLAYVGNTDFGEEENGKKVDMAQSPRAPGSSFKPFVYATAFTKGYGPASVLYDVQTKFGGDQPSNYDGTFWGLTTARKALGGSRNIPAIKTYFLAGEETAILNLTSKIGVTSPLAFKQEQAAKGRVFDYGWPLALGAGETPLLEMVEGYSAFADSGRHKPVISIRRITDRKGILLYEADTESTGEQVIDPRIAYEITSILSDTSARPGEFWQAALSIPGTAAAAKTGTSNKCLDRNDKTGVCKKRKPDNVWTMGYTPTLAAGVWVGNADSTPLSDSADGLNVAAPIWKEFMTSAQKILKPTKTAFTIPPGIVQPQVSLLSGQLPTECTPVTFRKSDIFLEENAPTQADPACVTMLVDKATSLKASANCPADTQEMQSFFAPQSEMPNRWPLWEEAVQSWAHSPGTPDPTDPTKFVSFLPLPLPPTEECDIAKTPDRLIQPKVSIIFPAQGNGASYPAFQPKIEFTVGSMVREIEFKLDGKTVAKETASPFRAIVRVPRSVQQEGSHTLTVILTDEYYNTATDSVSFNFSGSDTGLPTVRLRSPAAGTIFKTGSDLEIKADADAPAGVKYVEFYLDDLLLTRKPQDPYDFTYPLVSITPGPHTLRVTAVDFGGGQDSAEVEVMVEE